MPTTVLGLILFVVLLAPGFMASVARSRSEPEVKRTPLRETASIVFHSVISLFVAAVILAIIRSVIPEQTPDIGALLRKPEKEFVSDHVSLTWWSVGMFALACGIGFTIGRVSWLRNWLTPGPVSQHSAWWLTMAPGADYFSERPGSAASTETTVVHCVLSEGDEVIGDLFSFSPITPENDERDIVLNAPIFIRRASGDIRRHDNGAVIISSKNIKYFYVQKYGPR